MNSKKLPAIFIVPGEIRIPSGFPVMMRCSPPRILSEPGLGPSVRPWSNAAMKERPLSRSKSWPSRISAPFTMLVVSSDAGSGPPRRSSVGSPCQGLNRQSEVTSRRIIGLATASVNSLSARVLPPPDRC